MRFAPLPASAASVLVVDEGFIGSLHTAIGLRRAGLRVVLLGAVGGRSNYRYDGFTALTGPTPMDARFIEHVDRTGRRLRCDVVYATTEPTMLALDAALPGARPVLSGLHRSLIADKSVMSGFAARAGVPLPRAIPLDRTQDVAGAIAALGVPLVLKTVRGRGGDGTLIARSIEEARAFHASADAVGRRAFAQELVRGTTYLAGGLFREGAPVCFYAGEKVRQQPPGTGPAVLIRSVDEPALRSHALAIASALRWNGLASMDFIRAASGEFLFLELNPRPWGSIAAAQEAGVELFEPLAALLRGEIPTVCGELRTGVETAVLPLYLLHRDYRRPVVAWRQLRADLKRPQGEPFRDPRLLRHILYRLWRVKRNWQQI